MKVLVASIGFGSGHNKAADAVAEAVPAEFHGAEVKAVDFLNWEKNVWDSLSELVYFTSLKYIPSVYHSLYKMVSTLDVFHAIIFRNYIKKMERFLKYYPAEVIISTHVFCAKASCVLKGKNPSIKEVRGVLTDFIDDRYWNKLRLDRFFVATGELRAKLTEKGIPADAVTVSPIPVMKGFRLKKGREEACRIIDGRLNPNEYTVLILGGGNGLGGLVEAARSLIDLPVQILAVTGINTKVREELDRMKLNNPNLFVFGFINNVYDHMDAADICVTKPGGVTIAECMAKGLPIVIYGSPLPGPETENIDYLVRSGLSEFYSNPPGLRNGILNRLKRHRAGNM